jgi:2-phosphosulfolactate phosphatase
MNIDVVLLPADLQPHQCRDRAVVALDILRATTTIAAALQAGVSQIRIFPTTDEAARAAADHGGRRILCGEVKCLPPPGFDLGNSPDAFKPDLHAGQTLFMSTTNGTRAIVAAREAKLLLTGALVNASAVAQALSRHASNVILLCAGTDGRIAMEDLIGAGAIIDHLQHLAGIDLATDSARIALRLFQQARSDLPAALSETQGGRNILAVNLPEDITYAAQLDSMDTVGIVTNDPLTVHRLS